MSAPVLDPAARLARAEQRWLAEARDRLRRTTTAAPARNLRSEGSERQR